MDASSALQPLSIILQVVIILACLIIGAKKGGIALGLIAGIGLLILVFGVPHGRRRRTGSQNVSSRPAGNEAHRERPVSTRTMVLGCR